MKGTVLFEVGTEELPSGVIPAAMERLGEEVASRLRALAIGVERVVVGSTPRRLMVRLEGLDLRQPDRVEEVIGPPAKVGLDPQGNPTRAAEGFARKQGVDVSELVVRETPRGPYLCCTRTVAGVPTARLLPEILVASVGAIPFPKTMRWGTTAYRFSRPIRWLVCLLDDQHIPVELAGVRSGTETRGHRFLAPGPHVVPSARQYEYVLRANWVEVDPDRRRAAIQKRLAALAAEVGGRLLEDDELLDIVTHQVEYPAVVRGGFAERFLELPPPVLITAMREHQRYFSVLSPEPGDEQRLLPSFLALSAIEDGPEGLIRRGHEAVLVARLEDALFFFREDLKRPLADRRADLEAVMHMSEIGTMADKARRLDRLATGLLEELAAAGTSDLPAREALARAVSLCKADLVTHMVREFASLQGVMGRIYALRSGEERAVADALAEHYMPTSADAPVAPSLLGALVGLLDRLDNICAGFLLGVEPSGSTDPYALRRQAIGLIRTCLHHELRLDMGCLIDQALNALPARGDRLDLQRRVLAFLHGRLAGLLAAAGHRHDSIKSVLALDPVDLVGAVARVEAVTAFRQSAEFEPLTAAFKRMSRILPQGRPAPRLDEALLIEPGEQALAAAYEAVRPQVREALRRGDDQAALVQLAGLRPAVDRFFDEVMVMAEDQDVRANRLRLLTNLVDLFLEVADLREIVVES